MTLIQIDNNYFGLIEDYFHLIISNILVLLFFLFFQQSKQKANSAHKSHIAELEMSTTERITLEEEIDYLDSYLGLQKMRLDSKMEYKIEFGLETKY